MDNGVLFNLTICTLNINSITRENAIESILQCFYTFILTNPVIRLISSVKKLHKNTISQINSYLRLPANGKKAF